jgi:thiamine pyrophosphate-dependent acetolactate synthase large subunit-like protein
VSPSDDELTQLAAILNGSKKTTILAGAGCAGAHEELIELAGKLKAPIVHAMRGKEYVEYDNPFDVGMTGLLGFSSGYHASGLIVWRRRSRDADGRSPLAQTVALAGQVVVFNNSSLAFVELEMKAAGILDFGTDLDNPNLAKIAEAAGLLGLRAETPDQVQPMIEQALNHKGPALVEAMVSRQELSMPPTITLEQMRGFSLFMAKAVLSGRGDEIIDLARTNLFR